MINYEYDINNQRWNWMYIHHDGRVSAVYLKDGGNNFDNFKDLTGWFNSILRLIKDETSSVPS